MRVVCRWRARDRGVGHKARGVGGGAGRSERSGASWPLKRQALPPTNRGRGKQAPASPACMRRLPQGPLFPCPAEYWRTPQLGDGPFLCRLPVRLAHAIDILRAGGAGRSQHAHGCLYITPANPAPGKAQQARRPARLKLQYPFPAATTLTQPNVPPPALPPCPPPAARCPPCCAPPPTPR